MGHIMTSHGLGSRSYRDSYPDLEVGREWLLCRVCQAGVQFMKDPIVAHLRTHGLELNIYERDYMRPEDWPYHPDYVRPECVAASGSNSREEVVINNVCTVSQSKDRQQAEAKWMDPWNRQDITSVFFKKSDNNVSFN